MKKYKILFLTFHPQIGGGETILLSLIKNLDKKRFEPIIAVTEKGQLSEKLKRLKVKTYILPLPGYLLRTLFIPGASPVGIYRFYKLCKKIKPDLIHINHLNLVIYTGISAKILKIPLVATAHGSWDSIYFYQEILNSLFVERILAITPKVKNALTKRKTLNTNKVSVITPGIDTEFFKPGNKNLARKKLNLPQEEVIISIVGRIDPVKDHLTFLKAADLILKENSNVVLYIIGSKKGDFSNQGEKYLKTIKSFLKKHKKLNQKTIFADFQESMNVVYQASDILVSSSISESFGLAIAEAASSGLPIVSTNNGSQNLTVINNKTGFLIPPQNPKALAEKILTLAANPKLRIEFGKNGRKLIIAHFQLQHYVTEIEKVYLSLITNRLKSKRS